MELYGSGLSCRVLYPGYMDTEFAMINNQGEHDLSKEKVNTPLMWTVKKSAKVSVRAIQK